MYHNCVETSPVRGTGTPTTRRPRRVGKVLRATLVAVAVLAATVAVPVGAASAAGRPFTPTITCDPVTRTVTAGASAGGAFVPNVKLTIVFRTMGGSHASATASGPLPWPQPADVRVPVTTDATGSFSVRAFERPWRTDGDLFYHEKFRVSVQNATGAEVLWTNAACYHDRRTTAAFACDTGTGDVDLHTSGVLYGHYPSVRVQYFELRTYSQSTADSPIFVGQNAGPPTSKRTVTVPVAADGTWSDPGIQRPGPSTAYYAAADYMIVVSARNDTDFYEVGHGEGRCVWADRRPA